jgi:hypothetical protein
MMSFLLAAIVAVNSFVTSYLPVVANLKFKCYSGRFFSKIFFVSKIEFHARPYVPLGLRHDLLDLSCTMLTMAMVPLHQRYMLLDVLALSTRARV